MAESTKVVMASKSFEGLRQINEFGAEYWSARDLQTLLGYSQWRRFEQAIDRAVSSCRESGNPPEHHFAGAGKMIDLAKGAQRDVDDFHLSRFACYLIAQNGDPRKPEIAQAQQYFAIQTRRQELSDEAAADQERLELRKQTSEEFKALSGAAQQAGVQSRMFGVFHYAGYKGLYNGLGNEAIKAKKGIPSKENLMDRMNATELAANQFRMTQTRDKLAREGINSQTQALKTHEAVSKDVHRISATLYVKLAWQRHLRALGGRRSKLCHELLVQQVLVQVASDDLMSKFEMQTQRHRRQLNLVIRQWGLK
jgi:DNA-damage-inducible protein D